MSGAAPFRGCRPAKTNLHRRVKPKLPNPQPPMLPKRYAHQVQPNPGHGGYRQTSKLHVKRPTLHPLMSSIALESTLCDRKEFRPLTQFVMQSGRTDQRRRDRNSHDQATQNECDQRSDRFLCMA